MCYSLLLEQETDCKMARHPKPSAKNATGEYAAFENALQKVLSISHSELKSKLDAEKRKKAKRSSASRV
jgi:hypothetical protein